IGYNSTSRVAVPSTSTGDSPDHLRETGIHCTVIFIHSFRLTFDLDCVRFDHFDYGFRCVARPCLGLQDDAPPGSDICVGSIHDNHVWEAGHSDSEMSSRIIFTPDVANRSTSPTFDLK